MVLVNEVAPAPTSQPEQNWIAVHELGGAGDWQKLAGATVRLAFCAGGEAQGGGRRVSRAALARARLRAAAARAPR